MPLAVTIDGVDCTSNVVFPSLRKTDNLNQQVDSLDLTTNKYGDITLKPELGQEVVVTRDGATIFGGIILRISETVAVNKKITYRVQCADYSQYLKRQLVTERYEGMTAAAIVEDLITNYTSDGFTTTGVVAPQDIESISFNRLTVAECLQKLAEAISHVWYVDYDKDIHFFAKNAETAPFGLTDDGGKHIYDSLTIVEDLTQVRNAVLVQGGEVVSDTPRTELFSGDGTRTTFALANKYASLPAVEVGGSPQTVGVEFLDDDGSFDCMWNFNEKYLRFTAGNEPGSGTNNIEVTGTYLYPIVVSVPSPASQTEFGIYEFAITDKSIRSQDEAVARAYAELQAYQNELYEGSFRTYEDGLRSGQVLNITSVLRSKNIDVLIQSVTATMRDPEGTALEYEVRFVTLKSVGIIQYLQNQLRSKEVIIDDQETLLSLITDDDTIDTDDSLATPSTSTGPYVWGSFDWGYGTWSP